MDLYNHNLNSFSRANRHAGNLSEALLWNELKQRKLGYDFTKQKPIGNYIVDFYCKELKLVIEVDGWTHDNKVEYDEERDQYLGSLGMRVLHIEDMDVKRDMSGVIEWIRANLVMLAERRPSPSADASTPPLAGNKTR